MHKLAHLRAREQDIEMAQLGRIKTSLFVILLLHFTAVTGQKLLWFPVRDGEEVTLPCDNVIENQLNCDSTTWSYRSEARHYSEELVTNGQIRDGIPTDKADRLSLTENCSLVIKEVSLRDAGRYTCRQIKSGEQQGPDALVDLSVVEITEDQVNDTVTLSCSVRSDVAYGGCEHHTVEWLYEGDVNDVDMSPSYCDATVTFTASGLNQKSNYSELLKCKVTDERSGQAVLCGIGPGSSCVKPEVTGQKRLWFTVRDEEEEVTLPCDNVIENQLNCVSTTWSSRSSVWADSVELVTKGQISDGIPTDKADRLSLTENCSLVIKKVTDWDRGRYTCRQNKSGEQQGPDALVDLSVVHIYDPQVNDTVTLICFVGAYGECDHTVEWLYEGDVNDLDMSTTSCEATATFTASGLDQKSNYSELLLKCKVTDEWSEQVLLCGVGPGSSCVKPETPGAPPAQQHPSGPGLLRFILVSVGLATLIIIVVAVNIWERTTGKKTQMDDNAQVHYDRDGEEVNMDYENAD